jgi:NADH-quinone oxidoreductase subunit M
MKTVLGIFSIWGVVLGVMYMAWMYYRVVLNEVNPKIRSHLSDIDLREIVTLVPLVFLVFLIGVQPEVLLSYMHASVEHLLEQLNAQGVEVFTVSDSTKLLAQYIKEIF